MLPLDLHVLGTPPAFILSQDQTLHKDVRRHQILSLKTHIYKRLTMIIHHLRATHTRYIALNRKTANFEIKKFQLIAQVNC